MKRLTKLDKIFDKKVNDLTLDEFRQVLVYFGFMKATQELRVRFKPLKTVVVPTKRTKK